jgi:hypothetical protein
MPWWREGEMEGWMDAKEWDGGVKWKRETGGMREREKKN